MAASYFFMCLVTLARVAAEGIASTADNGDEWGPDADSENFCPPLDMQFEPSGRCQAASDDWRAFLKQHSKLRRVLWMAALQTPPKPGDWEVLFYLMDTILRINCVIAFWPCFTSRSGALKQLSNLCSVFRERLALADMAIRDEDYSILEVLRKSHRCLAWESGKLLEGVDDSVPIATFHLNIHLMTQTFLRADGVLVGGGIGGYRGPKLTSAVVPRWTYPPPNRATGECTSNPRIQTWDEGVPTWWQAPGVVTMLKDMAQFNSPVRGLFVNLGGNDGSCDIPQKILNYLPGLADAPDPANCLARQGYGGIVIEGDVTHFPELQRLFADRPDIRLHLDWIDPGTISGIVSSALRQVRGEATSFTDDVDLLKVDVDNCDCCFVETLLAGGLRPRMIHAEVHPLLPPPLAFQPSFQPDVLLTDGFDGGAVHVHCSLSAYLAMLQPRGYLLSHMVHRDAIFVRSDLKELFPWAGVGNLSGASQWMHGYSCHPLHKLSHSEDEFSARFTYDFQRWADRRLPVAKRMELVRKHLSNAGLADGSYRLWSHDPGGDSA